MNHTSYFELVSSGGGALLPSTYAQVWPRVTQIVADQSSQPWSLVMQVQPCRWRSQGLVLKFPTPAHPTPTSPLPQTLAIMTDLSQPILILIRVSGSTQFLYV